MSSPKLSIASLFAKQRAVLAAATLAFSAALAGCAATVDRSAGSASVQASAASSQLSMKIPEAHAKNLVVNFQLASGIDRSGWAEFRDEWKAIFTEQAAKDGIKVSFQEGEAKTGTGAGTLVVVSVLDYRNVRPAAKIMLGIMVGNAYINSKVQFRDLSSGQTYGERSYNSEGNLGHGIFSAVTPKQLYAVSDAMLEEIRRR